MKTRYQLNNSDISAILFLQLLVAQLCTVFGDESWNHIPEIPAGRRAQYLLLKKDGGYKYGYDTGDGIHAFQEGSKDNEVAGHFSFQGNNGNQQTLEYTSGVQGYIPSLSALTSQAHEIPISSDDLQQHTKTVFSSGEDDVQRHQGVFPTSQSTLPTSAFPEDEGSGAGDASYSFQFDLDDQARNEVSDKEGNIQGTYSYTSNDGVKRIVNYHATKEAGFQVQQSESPGVILSQKPQTGIKSVNHVPQIAPVAPVDTSYEFSYDAGDHSRSETGDEAGNVKGTFSFVTKDDGINRKVDYTAGGETGFIATGLHLPKSVHFSEHPLLHEVQPIYPVPLIPQYPVSHVPVLSSPAVIYEPIPDYTYHTHSQPETGSGVPAGNAHGSTHNVQYSLDSETGFVSFGSQPPIPHVHSATGAVSFSPAPPAIPSAKGGHHIPQQPQKPTEDESHGNASYAYSYKTNESSKQETSDTQGNVKGSFTFIGGDGVSRTIKYIANAETGFIASGDHLPKPGTYEAASGTDVKPHPATKTARVLPPVTVQTPVVKGFIPQTPQKPTHIPEEPDHGTHGDASYNYSYKTKDSSKQESSDANGNVQGTYTYIGNDGISRTVQYTATKEGGFVAIGDHLPRPGVYEASDSQTTVPPVSSSPGSVPGVYQDPEPNFPDYQNQVPVFSSDPVPDPGFQASIPPVTKSKNPVVPQPEPNFPDYQNQVPVFPSNTVPGSGSGFQAHVPPVTKSRNPEIPQPEPNFPDYQEQVPVFSLNPVPDPGFQSHIPPVSKSPVIPQPEPNFPDYQDQVPVFPSNPVPDPELQGHIPPVTKSKGPLIPPAVPQEPEGDGSYSYSFETDFIRKQEASDAQGNVQGFYSYTGSDGLPRRIDYTAKNSEGFIATGDILPKPSDSETGQHIPPTRIIPTANRPIPPGVKGHYPSFPGAKSPTPKPRIHNLVPGQGSISDFVLHTYLPPDSKKFGYIYDTRRGS